MYSSILMNERVFGSSMSACLRKPSPSLLSAAIMLCKHRKAPLDALISFIRSHLPPPPPLSIFSTYSVSPSLLLSYLASLYLAPISHPYTFQYANQYRIFFYTVSLSLTFLLSPLLFETDKMNRWAVKSFATGHWPLQYFVIALTLLNALA